MQDGDDGNQNDEDGNEAVEQGENRLVQFRGRPSRMPLHEILYRRVCDADEENRHDGNKADEDDPLCISEPLLCGEVGGVCRPRQLLCRKIHAGDDGDPLDPIKDNFQENVVEVACGLRRDTSTKRTQESLGDPSERHRGNEHQKRTDGVEQHAIAEICS